MPIPAIRTKQTTSTTGTGTLTLNAATAEFRSFNAAFGGVSRPVRYSLSRAGVYEVGYGTFNGGSPGTLTRDTIIASSNGGAAVSLGAGVTDVFFDFLPGERTLRTVSVNTTLVLADLGNLIRCTNSADITITLPASNTVPDGTGFLIKNDTANWSLVFIDPNGAELLDGSATPFPLFQGEAIEVVNIGTAWRSSIKPTGERMVARATASASATIDFILPFYPDAQSSIFRVDFRRVRPATDGAVLWMRTDADAGASYDAGATDYVWSRGFVSGAAAWTAEAPAAGAQIPLTVDIDSTASANTAMGLVQLDQSALGTRRPRVNWQSSAGGNTFAGLQTLTGSAERAAAQEVNAIRFLMSAGNIQNGVFTLFATYE